MNIYAIGDVHLSFGQKVDPLHWDRAEIYKPMDMFGREWHGHYRSIYENWNRIVQLEDLVLMPGDFSWAMKLNKVRFDLDFLGLLPGGIIGVAGNHDYWWQSLSQVRAVLPNNMRVIQNDHIQVGGVAICGSRGWSCPGGDNYSATDLKIYHRELIRMENSLKSIPFGAREVIVMTHFMPTNDRHEKNEMIEMFQKYKVNRVVYGHLHGAAVKLRLPRQAWGIHFHLVSADFVNFTPSFIMKVNS